MTRCHCGQPLHYNDPVSQKLVDDMVTSLGEYVNITVGQRTFAVQRHYIALHGLVAAEIPNLGFEEVTRS